MKKLFALIFLFTLFSIPAYAADYYIAQSAAGNADATSCVNAKAISYLTGSWSGKVAAGDTVHLCGTIGTENTTAITVGASGTAGNPITIKFETGARLSTTYFSANGAIVITSNNYIVIDGGTNGVLENTQNGSGLGNEVISSGIVTTTSSNLEIKNLTIQNILTHIYSDTGGANASAIYIGGGSNVNVHNNTVTQSFRGILFSNDGETDSNIVMHDNTVSGTCWPLSMGVGGGGATTTAKMYNNNVTMGTDWQSYVQCHIDGIMLYGDTTGTLDDVSLYNNYIRGNPSPGGTWGATGYIFWTSNGGDVLRVFNNVLDNTVTSPFVGYPANAFVKIGHESDVNPGAAPNLSYVVNNTFLGHGANDGHAVDNYSSGTTVVIENNIYNNVRQGFCLGTGVIATMDSNDYYGLWHFGQYGPIPTYCSSLADLHTMFGASCLGAPPNATPAGSECNSIATNPNLNTDFTEKSNSPTVGAGVNLTSLGITALNSDKAGNARPSSGAWDIGAYEYGSVTPPSVTISTPSQTIPSNSLAISGTATQGTNPISSCAWSIGTPLSGTNAGTVMTGTTSWSSSSNITSFSAGANTLYVGCVDNAGYWGNSSIVVTYTQIYNLSAVTTHGTVTSSPAGISCTDNTCNHSFTSQSVTLTESPDAGYTFSSWTVSGVPIVSGCTTGSTCVVTTNAIGTVTATYVGTPYNITVSQTYTGLTSCGSLNNLGVNQVTSNGSLTVTATLPTGCQLAWSGTGSGSVCTGHALTCTVSNPASDGTVIGTFTPMYSYGGGTHTGGSRR